MWQFLFFFSLSLSLRILFRYKYLCVLNIDLRAHAQSHTQSCNAKRNKKKRVSNWKENIYKLNVCIFNMTTWKYEIIILVGIWWACIWGVCLTTSMLFFFLHFIFFCPFRLFSANVKYSRNVQIALDNCFSFYFCKKTANRWLLMSVDEVNFETNIFFLL